MRWWFLISFVLIIPRIIDPRVPCPSRILLFCRLLKFWCEHILTRSLIHPLSHAHLALLAHWLVPGRRTPAGLTNWWGWWHVSSMPLPLWIYSIHGLLELRIPRLIFAFESLRALIFLLPLHTLNWIGFGHSIILSGHSIAHIGTTFEQVQITSRPNSGPLWYPK